MPYPSTSAVSFPYEEALYLVSGLFTSQLRKQWTLADRPSMSDDVRTGWQDAPGLETGETKVVVR